MSTRVPSGPGPQYDQGWMYWFWDWVKANRAGYTGTAVSTFTGDVRGTGTVPGGPVGMALSTTGVAPGTYGGTAGVPRFDIDAKGRVLSGTNVAFPAGGITAIVGAVTGTSTTGTLTSAFGTSVVLGPYISGVPVTLAAGAGTYMSYSVPALAGSGQGMSFKAWGTAQAGFVIGGFHIRFGSGLLLVGTATNQAAAAWFAEGVVAGRSASQQQYYTRFDLFTNNGVMLVSQNRVGTLGMNLSTSTPLHFTSTGTSTAMGTRSQLGLAVRLQGV